MAVACEISRADRCFFWLARLTEHEVLFTATWRTQSIAAWLPDNCTHFADSLQQTVDASKFPIERDIFAGILREWMEIRFSPIPWDGREWFSCWQERFAICGGGAPCMDGTDLSFKHPHEECVQRMKRWTCLAPAVTRD